MGAALLERRFHFWHKAYNQDRQKITSFKDSKNRLTQISKMKSHLLCSIVLYV